MEKRNNDEEKIDNKKEVTVFDWSYVEILKNSIYDVDEISIDSNHIIEDIQRTIKYMQSTLDNKDILFFEEPEHIRTFFENLIRLFYLRNELSPYLVCLTDKEYIELFKQGHCFSSISGSFIQFPKDHHLNHFLDDEHNVFLQKKVELNKVINQNDANNNEQDEPSKQSHLLKQLVFAHFPHNIKIEGKMTFKEYLDKIGLQSIAYLQERFDEMVTYKPHLEMRYYALTKVKDTGVSRGNHIIEKDLDFFNTLLPYITKCPNYVSKRATDRSKKYLVFQPYGSLSAKQVYEYFYQIYYYLFVIFFIKVELQAKIKIQKEKAKNFQTLKKIKEIILPESIIQDMATGFGYDLYLDYASRHWKGDKKKIVEKFCESLDRYVNTSIYNRMGSESTESYNEENDFTDNQNDSSLWYEDEDRFLQLHIDTDIENSASKENVRLSDEELELCNILNINSDYGKVLMREFIRFNKEHKSLIEGGGQNQIEFLKKQYPPFENHYLKTFSYMNISILKRQDAKYIKCLVSFLDFYVFTLLHDFYNELHDFDQACPRIVPEEIIFILKGQLWHLSYLFYRIDIVMLSNTDDEDKLSQKSFKDYILRNKDMKKEESIRKIFNQTLSSLKYNYIPLLNYRYFESVFVGQQKLFIKEYIVLLEKYLQMYSHHKDFYKVTFGNSDTAHNIRRFLYHTYQPQDIYADMSIKKQLTRLIQNIDMEVEK